MQSSINESVNAGLSRRQALGLLSSAFFLPPLSVQAKQEDKLDTKEEKLENAKAHYRKAALAVIEVLEQRLGFSFPDKDVGIEFRIPDRYEKNPHSFTALYDDKTKSLVFHPKFVDVSVRPIILMSDAREYPEVLDRASRQSYKDLNFIREVLAHELGHFYVDSRMRAEFPKSWIATRYQSEEPLGPEDLGLVVVQEGIGEYFSSKVIDRVSYFGNSSWQREWDIQDLRTPSVWRFLAYEGGYALVKPVIDKYGEKALDYFITNPLKFDIPSLENAIAYQEQALKELQAE